MDDNEILIKKSELAQKRSLLSNDPAHVIKNVAKTSQVVPPSPNLNDEVEAYLKLLREKGVKEPDLTQKKAQYEQSHAKVQSK